jgi:uncharacterized membrane protein YkoI
VGIKRAGTTDMKYHITIFSSLISLMVGSVVLAGNDQEELDLGLYAIGQSGLSVSKALAQVEAEVPGIVYEYELDEGEDGLVHEFDVVDLKRERKIKASVNIETGELTVEEERYDFGWFVKDDEDAVTALALQDAQFSLGEAIAVQPLMDGQLLLEIELEEKQGLRYFEFEALAADGEIEWLIDIQGKQIIPTLTRHVE